MDRVSEDTPLSQRRPGLDRDLVLGAEGARERQSARRRSSINPRVIDGEPARIGLKTTARSHAGHWAYRDRAGRQPRDVAAVIDRIWEDVGTAGAVEADLSDPAAPALLFGTAEGQPHPTARSH
jgi:hypothetical protein